MGFFQELKEDLSLAVNELLPEDEAGEAEAADEVNMEEISNEADQIIAQAVAEMAAEAQNEQEPEPAENDTLNEEMFRAAVDRIDENADAFAAEKTFAQSFVEELEAEQTAPEPEEVQPVMPQPEPEAVAAPQPTPEVTVAPQPAPEAPAVPEPVAPVSQPAATPQAAPVPVAASDDATQTQAFVQEVYEEVTKPAPAETPLEQEVSAVVAEKADSVMGMEVLDETAIVTKGMKVRGSISSQGALDVLGSIKGDVEILGKLNVSGSIEGNSNAAEVFADAANVTGDIHATGTVKIGLNSVIIGNIFATSAVIAGAVKGDIDVQGPVVLDSTAIIMGNIKSKSVQMNNGAVIEGMCSQCYAEVSPSSFFKDIK